MITPLEFEKKDFKGAALGYSKNSVDDFFDKVKVDYEKLYKENIELKDKIAMLNDSISQYKSMEEVLKTAMLAAQTSAEEIKKNAQEKADYTEFDKVVDKLEEIVNAPEGTYTEETVKNAQDALDNIVAGTDKDLPATEQGTLDEITSNLQDIVNSAEKKADYTDYNNAKSEAIFTKIIQKEF